VKFLCGTSTRVLHLPLLADEKKLLFSQTAIKHEKWADTPTFFILRSCTGRKFNPNAILGLYGTFPFPIGLWSYSLL
jgi:hypothetical protein